MKNDANMPKRLARTTIYESEHVCLYSDRVALPSGQIIENYYQIHYPKKAVAIVIFDKNENILLIQNRRYTVGRLEWEIPAGRIEEGEFTDFDEINNKKWFSKQECTKLLESNGTMDGVTILAILYALQFYK